MTFSALGGREGSGQRSQSLVCFIAVQKTLLCLKEALEQTLCSLLTSDMLDSVVFNFMLKTSCTISSASVADTRKW